MVNPTLAACTLLLHKFKRLNKSGFLGRVPAGSELPSHKEPGRHSPLVQLIVRRSIQPTIDPCEPAPG